MEPHSETKSKVTDPVCGMQVDAEKAAVFGRVVTHANEIFYFVLPDRFDNGDTGNDSGGDASGDAGCQSHPTHRLPLEPSRY